MLFSDAGRWICLFLMCELCVTDKRGDGASFVPEVDK